MKTDDEKAQAFLKSFPDYKPEEPLGCLLTSEEKAAREALNATKAVTQAQKDALVARILKEHATARMDDPLLPYVGNYEGKPLAG